MQAARTVLLCSCVLSLGTIASARSAPSGQTNPQRQKKDPAVDAGDVDSLGVIMSLIGELEGENDPKCHATATRLENFMFGTPLSAEARTTKVELQKKLVLTIWRRASSLAQQARQTSITPELMRAAAGDWMDFEESPDGGVHVVAHSGEALVLTPRDLRQYASVAYALRAILAVQQDLLLNSRANTLPADAESIDVLTRLLDVYTLAALFVADRSARRENEITLASTRLAAAWRSVVGPVTLVRAVTPERSESAPSNAAPTNPYDVLNRIIEQKLASYQRYNDVSMTLFWQNVKAFFARHDWPTDEREIESLQGNFSNMVVLFLADLLKRAEAKARDLGSPAIRAEHVEAIQQQEAPFEVNDHEDVVFFPRLSNPDRVVIESYDMDAFRDSGLHWKYLAECINQPSFPGEKGLDPFAAELVSEAAAQYAVLLFRMAGKKAKQDSAPHLVAAHFVEAANRIHDLAQKNDGTPARGHGAASVASRRGRTSPTTDHFFEDLTSEAGIRFEHRSSDWLSRFQRSYLYQLDEDRAPQGPPKAMDTPPSFSGGGVAAEDINNDGWVDLVLVGGAGNHLYLNSGGRFVESTTAEITFLRADSTPGEPRQPLIADFDNDGRQDLFISHALDDHRLYRNIGDGTFEDKTEGAGLGGAGRVGGPATVFDFDRDGYLDLYVGYFGNYVEGVRPYLVRDNINADPNRLFRNRGDWTFEDVTESSGAGDTGWAQAVTHLDLDQDGWQDLVVANDFGQNAYLRNLGEGRFEDWTEALRTDIPAHSMNVGSADLNADGYPDVYISNILTLAKDEKYVLPNAETAIRFDADSLATMRIVEANHLFLSVASGEGLRHYSLSGALERGENSTGWAWDADFFDFDNDGDDDLYVVNGHIEYPIYDAYSYRGVDEGRESGVASNFREHESNVLFVNQDGQLENLSRDSGADFVNNSRGAAYLDYDRDGDLDIIVNNFHSHATLLGNGTGSNGWLSVRLIGNPEEKTSRDAIGASLTLITSNGSRAWRSVQGGTGYLSAHPKEQSFGLGSDPENLPEVLTVRWPNGDEQSVAGLERNRRYVITQGQGKARETELLQPRP